MEQRAYKKSHIANKNENRKRLKVNNNPTYNRRYREKQARKNDRIIKLALSLITILIIASLGFKTIKKRNELNNKRYEYNDLVKDVISRELKRDRLEAQLESSIDLNRIQRYAIENLGMIYTNGNTEMESIIEKEASKENNENEVDGIKDDGSSI